MFPSSRWTFYKGDNLSHHIMTRYIIASPLQKLLYTEKLREFVMKGDNLPHEIVEQNLIASLLQMQI